MPGPSRVNTVSGGTQVIRRFALFFGEVPSDRQAAFREAVLRDLVPTWKAFPGAAQVHVSFTDEADDGATGCPLVLAIDFATEADLERALASEERLTSRAATQRVLPDFFTGKIFHYITRTHVFDVA